MENKKDQKEKSRSIKELADDLIKRAREMPLASFEIHKFASEVFDITRNQTLADVLKIIDDECMCIHHEKIYEKIKNLTSNLLVRVNQETAERQDTDTFEKPSKALSRPDVCNHEYNSITNKVAKDLNNNIYCWKCGKVKND